MGVVNVNIRKENVETGKNVVSMIELDIIAMIVEGKSDSEMSEILHLSDVKLKELKMRLFSKTNTNDHAGLIAYAIRFNII